MPSPQESFADLPFPLSGVDVSKGFGQQQPGTTPLGQNVRGYEPSSRRAKGGARPGLSPYTPQLPNGAHLIQNLNIVDPSNESGLLSNVFDWPGLPSGGVGDPSVPSSPAPPVPPIAIPGVTTWMADPTSPGYGPGHTANVTIPAGPLAGTVVNVPVNTDWGSETLALNIQSRNPGRIIPVGGSGAQPSKNKTAKKVTPLIVWNNPPLSPVGTILGSVQLNAVAKDPNTLVVIPGLFTYTPGPGAATTTDPESLYTYFVPADLTKYTVNTATVVMRASGLFVEGTDCAVISMVGDTITWTLVDIHGNPSTITAQAGDLLIVVMTDYYATDPGNPSSAVDSAGNNYSLAASAVQPATITTGAGQCRLSVWSVVAPAGTVSTVTIVGPAVTSDGISVSILQFRGWSSGDGSATAAGPGTAATTGNVPTVHSGELVVGVFAPTNDANFPIITAGPGFTAVPAGFVAQPIYVYTLSGGTPTQAVTATYSIAGYITIGVSFK